jgi:glycerate kinase
MKIIVATDKFKGTLSAAEASGIIAGAFRSRPGCRDEVLDFPMADGGEGTCEALTAARHGSFREVIVHGPLGAPVTARYGTAGEFAFMEMASASGLGLISRSQRNPMLTSTFGFGEMIADAIRNGATRIIAGIGGSATTDGGTGMAEALGARFLDASGNPIDGMCGGKLSLVAAVDLVRLRKTLAGVEILIASDVRNPLTGPLGAARVYGPQKGATPEMVDALDGGLAHLRRIVEPEAADDCGLPGDGAAGGLGFGCRVFCNAAFESGARLVMRESGVAELVAAAPHEIRAIITGEGCTDAQTGEGKLCSEIAALAQQHKIPCILLSGSIAAARSQLLRQYTSVFVSGIGRRSLEETLAHAAEDLEAAASSIAALIFP